jgi:hypothetical protein
MEAHASSRPSLHVVAISGFRIGTVGTGWHAAGPVIVRLQSGPWVVGVQVRPARDGTFEIGVKRVDLCGGVRFRAVDSAGRSANAHGPALLCAPRLNPPRPLLYVLKGMPLSPTTVRVLGPARPAIVRMHVGDSLYLWEPGTDVASFTPSVDPRYLALIAQERTPPRLCPQVDCALGFAWTWVALRPGVTTIDTSPACRLSTPPCGMPDYGIRVVISR